MRRILLVLTCLSVPGWSQPSSQQPVQPPIVVKVEMPPESIWTTLLKLAIPTILGAGLGAGSALLGVRLTHKYETDRWQRREQLQVRKDFYFSVITAANEFRTNLIRFVQWFRTEKQPYTDPNQLKAERDTV